MISLSVQCVTTPTTPINVIINPEHTKPTYLGAKCWNTIPENIGTIECSVKFSQCMKSKFMSDAIQGVSSYEINNSFDYFYTLAM